MISQFFRDNSIEQWACCPISHLDTPYITQLNQLLPGSHSVIMFAQEVPKEIYSLDRKMQSFYLMGLVRQLESIAHCLSADLSRNGYFSIPLITYAPAAIDTGRLRGVIPLKALAAQAGLGSIGLNTLLISEHSGIRVWLSGVLTTMILEPTVHTHRELCLHCRKCIDACPTKALGDKGVDQQKCLNLRSLVPSFIIPFWDTLLWCRGIRKYLELLINTFAWYGEIACSSCLTACPYFDSQGNGPGRG